MKLRSIKEETDFSQHEDRSPLTVGDYYNLLAVNDTDAHGNKVPVFVFVGFNENDIPYKKYYSPASPVDTSLKIRVTGFSDVDKQYVKVRVISNVDAPMIPYNRDKKELSFTDNGSPVTIPLKNISELENMDLITSDEHFEKYGEIKGKYDHGLVGYVMDLNNIVPLKDRTAASVKGTDEDHVRQNHPDYEDMTKMDKAIAIYKSFRVHPRKEVVEKFQKMLNMTKNGASSYYTKVHNIVEEEK